MKNLLEIMFKIFQISGLEPKGEYVIIIEGSSKNELEFEVEKLNEKSLEEHYKFYEEKNLSKKEIIKQIAKDRKLEKNEVYQYFMKN